VKIIPLKVSLPVSDAPSRSTNTAPTNAHTHTHSIATQSSPELISPPPPHLVQLGAGVSWREGGTCHGVRVHLEWPPVLYTRQEFFRCSAKRKGKNKCWEKWLFLITFEQGWEKELVSHAMELHWLDTWHRRPQWGHSEAA